MADPEIGAGVQDTEEEMSSHESHSSATTATFIQRALDDANREMRESRVRDVMRALHVIPRRAPTKEADDAQLREWAERAIAAYEGIK